MEQVNFEKHLLYTLQKEAKRLEKQYPQGNYMCTFEDIESLWHSDFTREQYKCMVGAYAMMVTRANDNRILPSETDVAKGQGSFSLFQTGNIQYSQILPIIYNARRNLHYPPRLTKEECKDLDNILKKPTPQTDVRDTGKWIVRSPSNRRQKGYSTSENPQDRLVANMYFDENIIKKLDDYCSQRRCWYKTSDTSDAYHRIDTLVIYSLDQFSDADKKEFIRLVSPYVRRDIPHRTNTLDGTLIAEGIATAPELNPTQCKTFIDNYRCSSAEKTSLIQSCTDEGKLKISLGQYTILQELSTLMEKFYPEQQNSQKKQIQQDAVLNSFDVYQDKQSNDFIFAAKNGRFLEAFEKLTDLGLDVKGGAGDGKGKRIFKASNTPENRRIILSLLERKKQSEHEKSSPKKTSRIGAILNTLQTNDVFLSKDSKGQDLIVFVPKEGVSRVDALGAVRKMQEAGMNIIAGARDKDNKPLYTTDPNTNSQKQNEWMTLLKQQESRKQ